MGNASTALSPQSNSSGALKGGTSEAVAALLDGPEDYRRKGEMILHGGLLAEAEAAMERELNVPPPTRAEVSEALAPLFVAFGKDDEDRAKIYTAALHAERMHLSSVRHAVRTLVSESKWLPSVAEVIGEARVAEVARVGRWTPVRYAMRLRAQASS